MIYFFVCNLRTIIIEASRNNMRKRNMQMENSIITKKKTKTAKNSQKRQQPNATPFNCNVCYSVEFNKFMHLFMPPHHILVNLSA